MQKFTSLCFYGALMAMLVGSLALNSAQGSESIDSNESKKKDPLSEDFHVEVDTSLNAENAEVAAYFQRATQRGDSLEKKCRREKEIRQKCEIARRKAAYDQLHAEVAARGNELLEDIMAKKSVGLFPLPFFASNYLDADSLYNAFNATTINATNYIINKFTKFKEEKQKRARLKDLKKTLSKIYGGLEGKYLKLEVSHGNKHNNYSHYNENFRLELEDCEGYVAKREQLADLHKNLFASLIAEQNFPLWESDIERKLLHKILREDFDPEVDVFDPQEFFATAKTKVAAEMRLLQNKAAEKESAGKQAEREKAAEENNRRRFNQQMAEMNFSWYERDPMRAQLRDALTQEFSIHQDFDWDRLLMRANRSIEFENEFTSPEFQARLKERYPQPEELKQFCLSVRQAFRQDWRWGSPRSFALLISSVGKEFEHTSRTIKMRDPLESSQRAEEARRSQVALIAKEFAKKIDDLSMEVYTTDSALSTKLRKVANSEYWLIDNWSALLIQSWRIQDRLNRRNHPDEEAETAQRKKLVTRHNEDYFSYLRALKKSQQQLQTEKTAPQQVPAFQGGPGSQGEQLAQEKLRQQFDAEYRQLPAHLSVSCDDNDACPICLEQVCTSEWMALSDICPDIRPSEDAELQVPLDPKLHKLSVCGHLICRSCLERLEQETRGSAGYCCPLCRGKIPYHEASVEEWSWSTVFPMRDRGCGPAISKLRCGRGAVANRLAGWAGNSGCVRGYDEQVARDEMEINYFGPMRLINQFSQHLSA